MKNKIILILSTMSIAHIHADFLVQNDSDRELRINLVFAKPIPRRAVLRTAQQRAQYNKMYSKHINPREIKKIEFDLSACTEEFALRTPITFVFEAEFEEKPKDEHWLTAPRIKLEDKRIEFSVPSQEYGTLLKNAKKYLPTILVTKNPATGDPIAHMPKDEKELKEAIEKVKQEHLSKMHKEVHEALPQMPQGGGKGIPGLISEYALEEENQ